MESVRFVLQHFVLVTLLNEKMRPKIEVSKMIVKSKEIAVVNLSNSK